MRSGFGLNTNLFETNLLNLVVVLGIVVVFVGDALRTLLDHRRQEILTTLREIDEKIQEATQQLEEARTSVETARSLSQEIRARAIQDADRESRAMKQKLEEDLQCLRATRRRTIQSERYRAVQYIVKRIINLSLTASEKTLSMALEHNGTAHHKQKELNEVHVRETLCQLKKTLLTNNFLYSFD